MIVWDLPTRIFHWSLVVCVAGSYMTSEDGDSDLHEIFGLSVIGLVVFRVMWGFVGSEPSRFSSFITGPGRILAYLSKVRSGDRRETLTHNPLGAWSVVALLAVVLVQASLGLFSTDDILFEGPLNSLVSYDTAQTLTGWHHLTFDVLVGLIGLHLFALLVYLMLLQVDVVSPMITGNKMLPEDEMPRPRRMAPLWLAVLLAAVSAALSYGITLIG
jgi:cytochrome b